MVSGSRKAGGSLEVSEIVSEPRESWRILLRPGVGSYSEELQTGAK